MYAMTFNQYSCFVLLLDYFIHKMIASMIYQTVCFLFEQLTSKITSKLIITMQT